MTTHVRALASLAAGFLLMLGMLGHALTAPTASAQTDAESLYISLLAQDGIGPAPGYSYGDLTRTGHHIAYDLRSGVDPAQVAYRVWLANPTLTRVMAARVVAAAMVAFVPEMVPIYTGDQPVADMVV
ncbi:DUF732 domain-containing protein [Mycolicibacterium sp. XJ1819]